MTRSDGVHKFFYNKIRLKRNEVMRMEPTGKDLMRLLVKLLAEQEGVKIEYIVERGQRNDETYSKENPGFAAS